MVTIFKNLTNIVTVFGDYYLFGEETSNLVVISVLVMTIGAIMSGVNDLEFSYLGFVHGDIKPDNIVIDPVTFMPKLIDFGGSFPVSYKTSYCMCTRSFKDPSLLFQDCVYHSTSDIFSFSLVLGYIISHEYFIDENDTYHFDKFEMVISKTDYLPVEIKRLLLKMAHPDHEKRAGFEDILNTLNTLNISRPSVLSKQNVLCGSNDFMKNHIKIILKHLNYEEYDYFCQFMLQNLIKKNNKFETKMYITICIFILIVYFDRADIKFNTIKRFLEYPIPSYELKKMIVELIATLQLVLIK
jgi:serine/threonine protein kinase